MLEKRKPLFFSGKETGCAVTPEPDRPVLVPVTYNWYNSKQVISAVVNLLNIVSYGEPRKEKLQDGIGVDLLFDLAHPGGAYTDFPYEMTMQIPASAASQESAAVTVTLPLPHFLNHIITAIEEYRATDPVKTAPLQSTLADLTRLATNTQGQLVQIHFTQINGIYAMQALHITPLSPSQKEAER